ncbi:MAG: hypothetical protein CVT95_09635 [Bacteroidetes bacterium HGW-Bacteroidetes-12]|nr:MAG: hypothetical protein CVT95_09635 [Bacteroidetes bacterium HGW-Bacteroidetes-12]
MPKIIIIILTIFVCSITEAQSLIKFGITYTIGKEQSLLGKKKDKNHETNVNSSYGGGLTIDLGYIYLNNNNFGPEATLSFFLGKPKTIEHIIDNEIDNLTIVNRKMLFFSPALFVVGSSTNDVNPYISSGLLFNLWGNITKTEYVTKNETEKAEKTWKVTLNKGIGYKSKLGILYATNENLLFFGELQYQMIALAYKRDYLINYVVNGADKLSTLTISEKEIEYQIAITHDSNYSLSNKFDINKPLNSVMQYANYNHFGVSGGLFWKP